ncbi:MAG: hypothetical protein HPY89_10665 [Pelotomaculum sp.]|nr:hypothetical protein [Pelotomaculum sp.]
MKAGKLRTPGLFLVICVAALLLLTAGCSLWGGEEEAVNPLVIKPEDFGIFLFESSEEIYRANVKDPQMWARLREYADRDPEYAAHYKWLYDTYVRWDEYRRSQLKEIMEEYLPQPMSERLIKKGKQTAGLNEVIEFIRTDRFFAKKRSTLVDFYAWYGANYALPHYEQVRPLLQRKADIAAGMVEKGFDIVGFMEKESGIKLKERPGTIELLLNMRMIGASGFYRDRDSLTTIQWGIGPEKIWAVPFHELSHSFFATFTRGWYFKYLAWKMKKDEKLMERFKEDVPYTWEGWIEENLAEGFSRYISVRKGITRDVGEGIYVFDKEFAEALVSGFNPKNTSLKDFTIKFLKQKYNI